MAVTNTGIVERVITGVNDGGDLFLDNSTGTATNTGIVERSITGVHDANFVHPLGDELVVNGGFDSDSDWTKTSTITISNGVANIVSDGSYQYLAQSGITTQNKSYKLVYTIVSNNNGALKFSNGSASYGGLTSTVGTHTEYFKANTGNSVFIERQSGATDITIDNISVKEVLVSRESTVNNTGIVERPITGVNESDPMFPDNATSSVVNISEVIIPLIDDLKARAEYFENEEGTKEILINLQKC